MCPANGLMGACDLMLRRTSPRQAIHGAFPYLSRFVPDLPGAVSVPHRVLPGKMEPKWNQFRQGSRGAHDL